jgi:hypothetical protein
VDAFRQHCGTAGQAGYYEFCYRYGYVGGYGAVDGDRATGGALFCLAYFWAAHGRVDLLESGGEIFWAFAGCFGRRKALDRVVFWLVFYYLLGPCFFPFAAP